MKLTIDRKKWLRGEGNDSSFLLRASDGKMCCVGFLAKACGHTDDDILGKGAISRMHCALKGILPKFVGPIEDPFMPNRNSSLLANEIYEANDSTLDYDNEIDRERVITQLMKDIGVDVEFVG